MTVDRAPESRPRRRIILLSPSGWGNEGDNAILRGLAGSLEGGSKGYRIVLATLSPEGSAEMVGRPSVPIMGVSKRGYYLKGQGVTRPGSYREEGTGGGATNGASAERANLARRLKDTLPDGLRTQLARLAALPDKVSAEIRHAVRVWRWLRRTRAVVVAGGGQLNEVWGGPWGHPYAIATWALLARLRGVDFHVLGVGAGETSHLVTRIFLRFALRSATYVSVRDARTAAVVVRLGRPDVRVTRDLAFLLVGGVSRRSTAPLDPSRLTIGVSPMAYKRPGIWPRADERAFANLTTTFERACEHWLARGHDLEFFVTDRMDRLTTSEIVEALRDRFPDDGRISFRRVDGLTELVDLISRCDVSVVARLHGAILSQIAGVPPVAISHDWKVDEQLWVAGRKDRTFDPTTVDADDLVQAVDKVAASSDSFLRTRAFAESCRDIVQQEIQALFQP